MVGGWTCRGARYRSKPCAGVRVSRAPAAWQGEQGRERRLHAHPSTCQRHSGIQRSDNNAWQVRPSPVPRTGQHMPAAQRKVGSLKAAQAALRHAPRQPANQLKQAPGQLSCNGPATVGWEGLGGVKRHGRWASGKLSGDGSAPGTPGGQGSWAGWSWAPAGRMESKAARWELSLQIRIGAGCSTWCHTACRSAPERASRPDVGCNGQPQRRPRHEQRLEQAWVQHRGPQALQHRERYIYRHAAS